MLADYFGQSVETCGFLPKRESFGCLWVQNFTNNSRIYHGWICYVIHFRFRVRLGVAWDCRSAKHVTSPLVFFSITFHPYDSYDVFLEVSCCGVVASWPWIFTHNSDAKVLVCRKTQDVLRRWKLLNQRMRKTWRSSRGLRITEGCMCLNPGCFKNFQESKTLVKS